jgi:ribosomal protein S18 acetylase RimI-like enzyme
VPEVLIRACRADEVDAVLAVWEAADAPESTGADRAGVEGVLRRDREALLVAELDGRLVGTVVAGWDGWRANLYRLAVLPELRRHGIALRLVEAAEARLRALGARRCGAIVLRDNTPANGLWAAAGFATQDEVRRYVRNYDSSEPTTPT